MKIKKISAMLAMVVTILLAGCGSSLNAGIEHLEKKQYEKAVESFGKVIETGKELGEAYHGQGIAYWELQEYDKAKASLENALENKVKETATLYQILGDCEMQLGNYEHALSYYWKAMSSEGLTEKQLQEISYNEVIAYEELKDWSSAKLKMAAYVQKYPDDVEALKEAEFLETR